MASMARVKHASAKAIPVMNNTIFAALAKYQQYRQFKDSAGVDRDLNYLRTNVRDDPKLTSCYFSQRCL
jgi:hypothetical protein